MATAKRKSEDHLLAATPDGHHRMVPCTYEGIKEGLDGATFDFVHNDHVGMYVDDEGMLKELPFNVPASILMARALFGPVVLCAAHSGPEGETLPAEKREVSSLAAICRLWQQVVTDAERLGQVVIALANADTIPPPKVYAVTDEAMEQFFRTGRWEVLDEQDD